MIRSVLAVVVGLVAIAIGGHVGLDAQASAIQDSRSVDRTFRCTPVALAARLRDVDVDAIPKGAREKYNPGQPRSPGFIGIGTGSYAAASELVAVRARRWWRFETGQGPEGVWVARRRCAESPATVALSPRGLPPPSIRWAEHGTCLVRGGILVRVRATLERPTSWASDQEGANVGAWGNVQTAALAVRSARTGRPVAYVELDRAGRTRLWFSADCK